MSLGGGRNIRGVHKGLILIWRGNAGAFESVRAGEGRKVHDVALIGILDILVRVGHFFYSCVVRHRFVGVRLFVVEERERERDA